MSDRASSARSATESGLPPKIASLLRECWWLLLISLACYLALILYTYQPADPGWSHSSSDEVIRNAGGRIGAWFADLLFYLFGVSAWWWVALCLFAVRWSFRRIEDTTE